MGPRLTAALVCGLVYAAYLMLRRAIEEPTSGHVGRGGLGPSLLDATPLAVIPSLVSTRRTASARRRSAPRMDTPASWHALAMLLVAGRLPSSFAPESAAAPRMPSVAPPLHPLSHPPVGGLSRPATPAFCRRPVADGILRAGWQAR